MAALSLLSGPVATAPKCVIGIPLVGVCIGATAEPSPSPTTSPPIAPAPAPETSPAPAPVRESEQPAPAPTQQWQPPRNEALVVPAPATELPPVATRPAENAWASEPTEEAVVTGPAEGIPTPVSRPSTAAASTQPEPEGASSSAPATPDNPLTERASENTEGTDLNAVLIGTILVHLGIALIWLALFILPALWSGTKTMVVREVRQPRHLNPRRGTP
jgi:hypothetical protein